MPATVFLVAARRPVAEAGAAAGPAEAGGDVGGGGRVVVLAPEDNVAVACTTLEAGTVLEVGGARLKLERRVTTGHKVARRPIRAGEKVVKYGAPIGSATRDIAPGAHVHTHNLKSDYIPTYDRKGREAS